MLGTLREGLQDRWGQSAGLREFWVATPCKRYLRKRKNTQPERVCIVCSSCPCHTTCTFWQSLAMLSVSQLLCMQWSTIWLMCVWTRPWIMTLPNGRPMLSAHVFHEEFWNLSSWVSLTIAQSASVSSLSLSKAGILVYPSSFGNIHHSHTAM